MGINSGFKGLTPETTRGILPSFIAVRDNPLTPETTRGILPSFIAVPDNPLTPETTRSILPSFIAVPDNPLTSETTRGILPSFIAVPDNPLTSETTRGILPSFIAVPDNPLTPETTRGILPSFIAVPDNPLTPETTRLLHVFQSTTFHPILHKIYLNGHLKIHQQEWESNVFFSICLSRKVMIFRTTLHTGFVTARNITKDSVDVTASSNRKHRIELL